MASAAVRSVEAVSARPPTPCGPLMVHAPQIRSLQLQIDSQGPDLHKFRSIAADPLRRHLQVPILRALNPQFRFGH